MLWYQSVENERNSLSRFIAVVVLVLLLCDVMQVACLHLAPSFAPLLLTPLLAALPHAIRIATLPLQAPALLLAVLTALLFPVVLKDVICVSFIIRVIFK